MRGWVMLTVCCVLARADLPAYYQAEFEAVLAFADGSGLGGLEAPAVYGLTQVRPRACACRAC